MGMGHGSRSWDEVRNFTKLMPSGAVIMVDKEFVIRDGKHLFTWGWKCFSDHLSLKKSMPQKSFFGYETHQEAMKVAVGFYKEGLISHGSASKKICLAYEYDKIFT